MTKMSGGVCSFASTFSALFTLSVIFSSTVSVSMSDYRNDHNNNLHNHKVRHKRHTPFLPDDHWKGGPPEFGPTKTDVDVMINGTVDLVCPIGHVQDLSLIHI